MDKPQPAVIYKDVKDTIAGTSKELLELVNPNIYSKFSSVLCKHPVIIVNNQVPANVLKWYETYVFKQPEPVCVPEPIVVDKEPEPKAFKNDDLKITSAEPKTIIEMVPEPQPVDTQNVIKSDSIQYQESVPMDIADLLPELSGETQVEDKQAEFSNGCKDFELMQEITNGKDFEMTQELPTISEEILNSFLNELPAVELGRNDVEARDSESIPPVNIAQISEKIDAEPPKKVTEIKQTVVKPDNTSVLSTIDEENNILDFD